ncbi:MAG: tetratricopeptide repeat protein, partial [Bacteroidota bacterium]|nr:tetratricopeptide repeat protein [Bacteroidota bacterium]
NSQQIVSSSSITEINPPIIISSTLAEIYANQGEYAEAINMYKALMKIKPNQKSLFEEKIKILEEKLKHDA